MVRKLGDNPLMRELTLYDSAISGNSYKCRLLLNQLEVPYKLVPVDLLAGEARSAGFKKLNPFYRVPFLTYGDFGLGESNAILLYLARGSRYLPDDARTQALIAQWMFFEQNQLEASIAVSRWILKFEPNGPLSKEMVATQRKRGQRSLEILEHHLSTHDFLVSAYSVADIALFGYTPLATEGGFPLDGFPAIRRWIERVREQPRFIAFG
jgi:glutathione S-transferase